MVGVFRLIDLLELRTVSSGSDGSGDDADVDVDDENSTFGVSLFFCCSSSSAAR